MDGVGRSAGKKHLNATEKRDPPRLQTTGFLGRRDENKKSKKMTSWWFQPTWKILVKMGNLPQFSGWTTIFWNHHLEEDEHWSQISTSVNRIWVGAVALCQRPSHFVVLWCYSKISVRTWKDPDTCLMAREQTQVKSILIWTTNRSS